jgi:hypothetical protein
MNKKVLQFAIFALLAANIYGQTASKALEIDQALMKKMYEKLPDDALPEVLQNGKKRMDELYGEGNRLGGQFHPTLEGWGDNVFDGTRFTDFQMAGFPFDDGENILLIVQYAKGADGNYLESDKTLNYHIKTEKITSIERPIEPFTPRELIEKIDYGDLSPRTKNDLIRWFDNINDPRKLSYNFTKEGFELQFCPVTFDTGEYPDWFWLDYNNSSPSGLQFRWDGKRFVKVKDDEAIRVEIPLSRTNVNLRNAPRTGTVITQANNGDVFMVKSNPEMFDDDGSVWYTIVSTVDDEGNIHDAIEQHGTLLYVAARFISRTKSENDLWRKTAPPDTKHLLRKIYMDLPASYLPRDMRTAAQRIKALGEINENRLDASVYGDVTEKFALVCYPFDDGEHLLLIAKCTSHLDVSTLFLDKTFKYNIKTGKMIEVERPADPYTADELIDGIDFGDVGQGVKDKIKQWLGIKGEYSKIDYYDLNASGYTIIADYNTYNDGEYDFDFWYAWENASEWASRVYYQWDGNRFVKVKEAEYSRITIPSGRTNVNLHNSPNDGDVMMQVNEGDVFIIKSEPTVKDDGSAWYTVCYAIDKDGVMTCMPTFLYVAARFAYKDSLEDGDAERMAAAEQRAAAAAQ